MSAAAALSAPSFPERVASLLERVDYRRADTVEEREAIFRLRYDAYLREGAIKPSHPPRYTDALDDTPNCWIFGIYLDGELASSIRLHVAAKPQDQLPALNVFSDLLSPAIEAGKVIIDPTRFVADFGIARAYPELPYITVRIGWLAGEYFKASGILATVRAEHQAFYKRIFGHRPVCPPRPYPSLEKPISLMMLDYPAMVEQVHRRYPFFRSTFFERRMLFERPIQKQRAAAA